MTPTELYEQITDISTSCQSDLLCVGEQKKFKPTKTVNRYFIGYNATFGASPSGYMSLDSESEMKRKFQKLARQWENDTAYVSSIHQIILHHSYQEIIGMGHNVIPLIFNELEKKTGLWFWALQALTGENPVTEDAFGDFTEMRRAWLSWGDIHGYL
ncbi:hypothetical protein ACFL3G_02890 [Planctomycetota bacterium]